jgi:hypothetical protein
MGLFGSAEVDWTVNLDGGRMDVAPGGLVRATISLRPRSAIEPRRILASLIGVEEYAYEEVEHDREGSSNRGRQWATNEVLRQDVQLSGPDRIGPGEVRNLAVQFQMPPNALPSLESTALRMRWKLVASIDVGGVDPKVEQGLVVPLLAAMLPPQFMATAGERVDVMADGQSAMFWAQPAPIRAGAPFSGAVDMTSPLDLGGTRLELKLNVSTTKDSSAGAEVGAVLLGAAGLWTETQRAVRDSQVLWRGALTEVAPGAPGWRRYAFGGQLPLAPVVTGVYPHGVAAAVLDVVQSRSFRPDGHITRPVAIVTG